MAVIGLDPVPEETSAKTHWIRRLGLGVAIALVTAFAVLSPASGSPDRACTNGDAQALVQALPVASAMRLRGHDHPGLLEAFAACQYRVFFDGRTFTFSESDHFVGGIAWFADYKAAGISRDEAIAEIESTEDRVWIAKRQPDGSIGARVAQPLTRTAYKGLLHPVFGQVVYQHRAFVSQLPAGEYVSYWESTSQGLPTESATVQLVILPG